MASLPSCARGTREWAPRAPTALLAHFTPSPHSITLHFHTTLCSADIAAAGGEGVPGLGKKCFPTECVSR